MIDPILIMATPRSGSSMTAGIFARHGIFTGKVPTPDPRNPHGSFESRAIRKIIPQHNGKLVNRGLVSERVPGLREKIEAAFEDEGYKGGPWLWKGSALYWPAFYEWPSPKWVTVRRDFDATIRSLNKPPYALKKDDQNWLKHVIRLHHEQLDVLDSMGAFAVDSQAVAHGDFTTIKAAIEGCGIAFDERIARDFVIPGQWHQRA